MGQILSFPIDFDRRPYNTLALPCECVIPLYASVCRHLTCGISTIIIPAKAKEYVFTGVGLCVCVSVCDHDNYVDGFAPNFMQRFLGGKGKTKFLFGYDR